MTSAVYVPWLKTDRGYPIQLLDKHLGFTYTKSISKPGWFTLRYPVQGTDFNDPNSVVNNLDVDRQIQIFRKGVDSNQDTLDFLGFVRKWGFHTDDSGATICTISGSDQNELIGRRIVAYDSADNASKTLANSAGTYYSDNNMKDAIRANLGSDAASARQITGLNFSIGDNQSLGTAARKKYAWQNMLKVLEDLTQATKAAGTEVFWKVQVEGISADGTPIMNFVTFPSAPGGLKSFEAEKGTGTDSETDSGANMIFGLKWGNLYNPSLTYDYSEEYNYIYVGGAGEGSMREIVEVSDDNAIARSVWNRREKFINAQQQSATGELTSVGNAALNAGRPIISFSGTIVSSIQTPYGEGWDIGSQVSVEYVGQKFNGLVRSLRVKVASDGSDEISAKVEYEAPI